jgi:hypothetical protein
LLADDDLGQPAEVCRKIAQWWRAGSRVDGAHDTALSRKLANRIPKRRVVAEYDVEHRRRKRCAAVWHESFSPKHFIESVFDLKIIHSIKLAIVA